MAIVHIVPLFMHDLRARAHQLLLSCDIRVGWPDPTLYQTNHVAGMMNRRKKAWKKQKRKRKSTEASGGSPDKVEQTLRPKPLEPTPDSDDVTRNGAKNTITGTPCFVASVDFRVPLQQKVGPTTGPPQPSSASDPRLTSDSQEQLLNKNDSSGATKSKQKRKRNLSDLPKRQLKHLLGRATPHKFITSSVNEVKCPPWMSEEEFTTVYSWLYSNKTELMQKGVARVAAWSTRCNLPVGITITAHLCEAFLMEMEHNAGNSCQAMSFGYSVAITRSVRSFSW